MSSSDPIDPLVQQYAQASAVADHQRASRARKPIVYVSTSEGQITEWMAYRPDGTVIMDEGELPVIVIQIDWDDVRREDLDESRQYGGGETSYVRGLLNDERIPKRVLDDIHLSLLDSRSVESIEELDAELTGDGDK